MNPERLAFFDGAPLPLLAELLASEDPAQRADAACTLGDRLRTREIPSLSAELIELLAGLLKDSVPMVRFEAAMALAEAKDVRATPILLESIHVRMLRLDAIRALGTLGDRSAVEALGHFMRRWLLPWADKLQTAAALCALGDATGAEYVKSRVESRRSAERAAALHFLGESRHPEAREILEAVLGNASHPLRDVAARALGLLRDARSREALEAARGGADAELLADIDEALKAIGGGPSSATS